VNSPVQRKQYPVDGPNMNTLPLTLHVHRVGLSTGFARFFTGQNKQMTYTKAIQRLLWIPKVHYHLHKSLPPVVTLSKRQGPFAKIITICMQVLLSVASFLLACVPDLFLYACVLAWPIASDQAGLASRAFLFHFLDFQTSGRRNRDEPGFQSTSSHSTYLRSILIISIYPRSATCLPFTFSD
jgi:hypothetical protein